MGRDPGHLRHGIALHRVKDLDSRDVRRYQNTPLTSPARTLLELAAQLPARDLELALDEAIARKLVSRPAVSLALKRYPRRNGCALLAELVTDDRPSTITRSGGEERMLALMRKARLPQPELNARFGRFTVDFLWRSERVAFELDGYPYHSSRLARERDHAKDAALQAGGFLVIRITGRQLKDEPEMVLALIAAALARASRAST